jgi:hypothetical protein
VTSVRPLRKRDIIHLFGRQLSLIFVAIDSLFAYIIGIDDMSASACGTDTLG